MSLRVWIVVGLLAVSACAPRNAFVLLEEPDGTVGAIEVSNAAGTQLIAEAKQGTRVADAQSAPRAPEAVGDEEIARTWGAALGASPRQPATFILNFITGTDQLTPESQAQLPDILRAIQDFPAPEVSVVGHTDTVGAAALNARLALQRANATRELLLNAGLQPDLIEVDSHGESNPLVPTADEVDEPRNRRVEVTVR